MRRRIRSGGALAAAIATTALLIHAPTHVDAGLSIGGVTSTDACYAALQSAKRPGENVVDTDGYVAFINELSDGAFTAFQYNEAEDKWDFYPVGDFEQLPAGLKGEFYKHACGGEYVICPNAFLYTDGTDGSDLDPQQEIYLYQVCVGVEGAIDEARPDATPPTPPTPAVPSQPTYPPTAPPPTPEPVELYTGEQQLQLTYRAVVSPDVSTEDLRSPESDTRKDLLGAMTSWSFMTGNDYYKQSNAVPGKRMLTGGKKRREMLKKEPRTVRPKPLVADPSEQELMQIIDVDCDGDMDMLDHHCVEVTTNLTLIFEDEPPGSEDVALQYFEDSFETDVTDGTFYGLISPKSQQTVKAVYLPTAENGAESEPGDGAPAEPNKGNGDEFDERIDGLQRDNLAEENTGDGGGSNVAGIVSGVVVGLVVAGVGLFLYRRRRQQLRDDDGSYKKKSMKDGFDPADDLEGGRAYSDGSSSRDEFSHSSSQSSSSVASYSGSEGGSSGSSDSSTSYTSTGSSREHSSSYSQSYSSREHGSSYSTSGTGTEGNSVGPPSVSASESMSHSASETDSYDNSPYNSGSGAAENRGGLAMSTQSDLGPYEAESGSSYASSSSSQRLGGAKKGSRSTRTDDDSSAGSSGWDSSDGDSSVDTGSVDSYDPNTIKTGDLSGSTSQSPSADGSSTLDEGNMPAMVNPAVNPVVQRGVTMIPIQESDNEDSTAMASSVSDESSNPSNFGRRRDEAPLGGDIQEAIEKGDWAAVGATAAILASDSSAASTQNDDNMTRDSSVDPSGEVSLMSGGSNTVDEDDERAAEIDQLVETGNWDGVVAVAARYADEADEADESLSQPLRSQVEGSNDGSPKITKTVNSSMYSETSVESAGSVSVETADASSSAYDTMSDASHSVYSSMGSASASASGTDSRSPSNPDTGTQSSSITSSYVSGGGITSSMFSADVSSVGVSQEKRQMSAYRAEVEALVRRVVPDEIDNVDDIMVQFSGREEELIETLRAMQEKSIAQRARAAVAKSAKREAGRTGRDMHDESSEDLGHSVNTEDDGQSTVSYATDGQSLTTEGQSYTTGQSGRDGSITVDDDYSTGSSRSSSRSGSDSSYSSRSSRSSGASGTEYSESQMSGSPEGKSKDGLSDAIDASDWRAVGKAAEHMRADGVASSHDLGADQSKDTQGEIDDLIEDGNWSGIIDAASNMTPSPDDLD